MTIKIAFHCLRQFLISADICSLLLCSVVSIPSNKIHVQIDNELWSVKGIGAPILPYFAKCDTLGPTIQPISKKKTKKEKQKEKKGKYNFIIPCDWFEFMSV